MLPPRVAGSVRTCEFMDKYRMAKAISAKAGSTLRYRRTGFPASNGSLNFSAAMIGLRQYPGSALLPS